MKKELFGKIGDKEVYKYFLSCGEIEADIINYGGIITDIRVKDKSGNKISTVVGYETLEQYIAGKSFYGAIIGRFGNRIEGGKFILDGVEYNVSQNEGRNTLHGGMEGFDRKIWTVKNVTDSSIELFYSSPDGEEGFPGELDVTVTYTLEDNSIRIDYSAVTDKPTVVSLTNHSYFNVKGVDKTTDDLKLFIGADKITPVDSELIPHGEFMDVENTLFDFRTPKPFICDLSADKVLSKRGCFDENFVLNGTGLRKIASIESEETGLIMEVISDCPGMQIYTGNPNGIALETQNFPNAVNCAEYPSAVLRPGEEYKTTTIYKYI